MTICTSSNFTDTQIRDALGMSSHESEALIKDHGSRARSS
jgi:hypothetical protein